MGSVQVQARSPSRMQEDVWPEDPPLNEELWQLIVAEKKNVFSENEASGKLPTPVEDYTFQTLSGEQIGRDRFKT